MILVDTSIWVDHLRSRSRTLVGLLEADQVLVHPFVIGELACGQLANRREILELLESLPTAATARHEDVLALLDTRRLYGKGIGWVDAHLLCSTLFSRAALLTLDRPLLRVAKGLGIAA